AWSAAAHAGAVYVPLPGVTQLGNVAWQPTVTIVDPSPAATQVKGFFIAGDTDGTLRQSPATPAQVDAGRPLLSRPTAGFRGLLEVSGSPLVRYGARLDGQGGAYGALGVQLPVITSSNLSPGGSTLSVQGLVHTATRISNVGVVNLAPYASQCTVTLTR